MKYFVPGDYVIPAGTQVVLRGDKPASLGSSKSIKKAGSVAVIVKCPADNSGPYLLQFVDGSRCEGTFEELALRRQEIDFMLSRTDGPESFRKFVIYRCQVGSKAFGLSNESSDDDIRGIYLPPAELHWSLYDVPPQLEFNDGQLDEVYWELEKFLRLALKANPNILETMWTPMVLEANQIATRLLEIREVFLSRHIFKTYSGYALSQFRRMRASFQKKGTFKSKHAMHLIRLMHSGIHALNNGEIMVDASEHREQLLAIRNGEFTFDQVEKLAIDLNYQFAKAFESSNLPEQPNFAAVDDFLVEVRRDSVACYK